MSSRIAPDPLDPTKMANQPALRTSSGLIWVVFGGLFAAAAMIPLGLLAFGSDGRSQGAAIPTAALILVLYGALLVVRFAVRQGPRRLRAMAVCMLSMAAVALVGVWSCLMIESAPR